LELNETSLAGSADRAGTRARDDIRPDVRTLHVARQGRKGRHFVVFREAEGGMIDVLRLIHDSMDLPRHLAGS
jgi:toxin ParE1/3/4